MPAFFKEEYVPPVEIISNPSLFNPDAKSMMPLLSETLIKALLGREYHLTLMENVRYKFFSGFMLSWCVIPENAHTGF